MSARHVRCVSWVPVVALAFVLSGCRDTGPVSPDVQGGPTTQALQAAMAIQEQHTHLLLSLEGVVGTATGLTRDGKPAIKVFTVTPGVTGIPERLDGIPVVVEVTGEFYALQGQGGGGPPGGGGGGNKVDPKGTFPRPVPIGVSTGNEGSCSAGTIGARVRDAAGNVYALSNNHVYALENSAPLGSKVLQPGLFDTNCAFDENNVIGTLADFEPIVFSTDANNTIDAAIAASSTTLLANSTPSDGYGTPTSATVAASVGQNVQKYGRTSSLTKGQIIGINATVNVGYNSGTARFVDQIVVGSRKPFIKAGDSGSLLVTDPGANPVGLLYAGTVDGKTAIANRIDLVLNRFSVTVDGQ